MVGPSASLVASSAVAASRSAIGTTRLTMPRVKASAADSLSPNITSSLARCIPMVRGSR
jgi:hypothetical protein